MNPSAPTDTSRMDVLGLHISNPSQSKASHAHPYASSLSSSASSSSSSVFSLDGLSQSSISSTSTNPVDVIWENDGDAQLARRNTSGPLPRVSSKAVFPNTDGPVLPELRMHPRRTNSATNGPARPPPCLLRQSERKVAFVDNLVGESRSDLSVFQRL